MRPLFLPISAMPRASVHYWRAGAQTLNRTKIEIPTYYLRFYNFPPSPSFLPHEPPGLFLWGLGSPDPFLCSPVSDPFSTRDIATWHTACCAEEVCSPNGGAVRARPGPARSGSVLYDRTARRHACCDTQHYGNSPAGSPAGYPTHPSALPWGERSEMAVAASSPKMAKMTSAAVRNSGVAWKNIGVAVGSAASSLDWHVSSTPWEHK